MKRILAVLLCLFIVFSVSFAGCSKDNGGKQADKTGDTTISDDKKGEGTKAPPEELSIFTWDNWYAPKSYASGELPVINAIEEKLNIKIKWVVLPASEFHTVANTKYAAGQQLEDVIMGGNISDLIDRGLIISFDHIIGDNTPNIVKLLRERPELEKFMTFEDGKMYEFPYVMDDFPSLEANWIRKDWLDKLDIPLPKTPEEYLAALKAFQDNDVNENGKKDEVYACSSNYFEFMSNIWNMNFAQNFFSVNDKGEVEYDYLEERGKLYLQFANKMWKENIFDRDIINMSYDNLVARLSNNQVGGITWYPWSKSWLYSQVKTTDPNAEYTLAILEGPYGRQKLFKQFNYQTGAAKITKFCKKPEVAMKFFDFVWASDEGFNLMNYGVENLTYKIEGNEYKYTDFVFNNPDGLSPQDTLWSVGCWINISNRQSMEVANKYRLPEDQVEVDKVMNYLEPLQSWMYVRRTQDEERTISEVSKDLNTYLEETKIKFIIGDEPIENYEKFGEKLKEMHIEKLMDIVKAQYERSK
jgi:putative aldouronate transport system substrate-binding protein